ncbi:unnamed protein product, partial [Cuscuta epithymum]
MGGRVDQTINIGGSPPVFKLSGQNYHLIGSLLPVEGNVPKFAQLYIYDTQHEDVNRLTSVGDEKRKKKLHVDIVSTLRQMLDQHNVLVKSFRMARDKIAECGHSNVYLKLIGRRSRDARTYNLPTVSEVAALIVGDFDESLGQRDIMVETQGGVLKRINELNPAYLGLQYPLLFPYGEDGYREDISFSDSNSKSTKGRRSVSVREFLAYRLHDRGVENSFILKARRLFQQFVVDGYTMVESSRLTYIRLNQKQLRCAMYKGLSEALLSGERDASTQGKRIVLPSTFVGGARYMVQNYQDAMAICRWAGYPDLFLTFTCNPKWPEIVRFLSERNLNPEDRPDIICRVFKMKLDGLIKDLRQNKIFGDVRAVVYTIEFQKRGLPHAHILLFMGNADKFTAPADIDRIISAEIPDESSDPDYFNAVKMHMMHGPCGRDAKNAPCMVQSKCSKHFPKNFNAHTNIDEDGYPKYMRRDDGKEIVKNTIPLDNRHVVPHNRYLLMKYGAHLNVEWCNQSRSIKYLFKYVNKGNDRVTAAFYETTNKDGSEKPVDEIKLYYDCRYVSPCEAMWRILGFEIQYKNPSVERLSFHFPDEQYVYFDDEDAMTDVVQRESVKQSMFLAWMKANEQYAEAKKLTYAEFPQKFVWKPKTREFVPRQRGFALGRVAYVPPGSGESYYLRCILNLKRGATSFADLRTVDEVCYETYRDTCYALGLLDDDREYVEGFTESSFWASAWGLRVLFVILLLADTMSRPEYVWDKCWNFMSDDILHRQRRALLHPDLTLTEEEFKNYALVEIETMLRTRGKSLRDYPSMPFPNCNNATMFQNRLIYDELQYDNAEMREQHDKCMQSLNEQQSEVYKTIMESIEGNNGGVFFVYGYGGTGKTFIWKTLSAALRSKGEIVLNVASSGIASLLLPGGRTAHSRFAIPINPTEHSTCNIKQGSPLAQLIIRSKLIIWDEAPMTHKYCFEALDRSLRDILRVVDPLNTDKPFGGKTIVFGGDFRQILPVITKGTRQDIVNATINSSYIWHDCIVLRLTKNMRLQSLSGDRDYADLVEFAEWIASLGDGTAGGQNDGCADIKIPSDILLQSDEDPIATIVRSTYPDFEAMPTDPSFLKERAILARTLDVVDSINEYMTALNVTEESRTYLSSDSICKSDSNSDFLADLHTPEFLNKIRASGVPNHELTLKVGTPVMLLRNIDHSMGLCNGTRLIITRLGNHVLGATILGGKFDGQEVVIPRLTLTPSDARIPFKFQRRQFPIMTSYAMTINKSQGQSLTHVGLLLKKPVFTHGQLYVAASRVTNRKGLKILICDED